MSLGVRDAALAERDAALTERDAALTERDSAVLERDNIAADRDNIEGDKWDIMKQLRETEDRLALLIIWQDLWLLEFHISMRGRCGDYMS